MGSAPREEREDARVVVCDDCGKSAEVLYELEFDGGWSQCDDYYNCGGCCSAGRALVTGSNHGAADPGWTDWYCADCASVYEDDLTQLKQRRASRVSERATSDSEVLGGGSSGG